MRNQSSQSGSIAFSAVSRSQSQSVGLAQYPSPFARNDGKQQPPHFFEPVEAVEGGILSQNRLGRAIPSHAFSHRTESILEDSRAIAAGGS